MLLKSAGNGVHKAARAISGLRSTVNKFKGVCIMGIKEFKEKIIRDKAFADKFQSVKTPEELVRIAAAEGFSFTVDDVKSNTELTDAELEAAAGGSSILAKTYFVSHSSVFAKTYFVDR